MQRFQGERFQWDIEFSIEGITRIKSLLGLDLLKVDQPDAEQRLPLQRLYDEPLTVIEIAGVLLHKQLKSNFATELSAGMTDEVTGMPLTLLDLLAIECTANRFVDLQRAILEDLQDFFRRVGLPERGAVIRRQIELVQQSKQQASAQVDRLNLQKALTQMEAIDVQRAFDDSIPGSTSIISPESSASIPAH